MPTTLSTILPTGRWTVDTDASELAFKTRGFFGLIPVHGVFHQFHGAIDVTNTGACGELVVQSASLDTRLAFRDRHLRAPDFFDVEQYPTFCVRLHEVLQTPSGQLELRAALMMRAGSVGISAPLSVHHADTGRLHLGTQLRVDRAAAGLSQVHHGTVAATAQLTANLVLTQ